MTIEYRKRKWCTVHCTGKDKGETIACFPTKEAANRQHRAIEASKHANKIEIDLRSLQKEEVLKAWEVLFANGNGVQYFEDESDADHFINTSKNKSWFEFDRKRYTEVPKRKKSGIRYSVNPKGTKITFEQSKSNI